MAATEHAEAMAALAAKAAGLLQPVERGKQRRDRLREAHAACKQQLQWRVSELEAELCNVEEQASRLRAELEAAGGGAARGLAAE